jgi:hypothetical protein
MVGPPSGGGLCLETMKIKVQWLTVGEPCKTVPIGCWSSLRGSCAGGRAGARMGFGSPGLGLEFVLAMGDDVTDEDLFRALPATAYSVQVGLAQTAARCYVNSHTAVRRLPGALVRSQPTG